MSPPVTAVVLGGLALVAALDIRGRLPSATSAGVVIAASAALAGLGYDLSLAAIVRVLLALTVLAALASRERGGGPAPAVFAGSTLLALAAAAGSVGLTAVASAVVGAVFVALAATAAPKTPMEKRRSPSGCSRSAWQLTCGCWEVALGFGASA